MNAKTYLYLIGKIYKESGWKVEEEKNGMKLFNEDGKIMRNYKVDEKIGKELTEIVGINCEFFHMFFEGEEYNDTVDKYCVVFNEQDTNYTMTLFFKEKAEVWMHEIDEMGYGRTVHFRERKDKKLEKIERYLIEKAKEVPEYRLLFLY